MDIIIDDHRIMVTWKIKCHRSHVNLPWEISVPCQSTCQFPTSGKHANKFSATFNRVKNCCDYSYYLSWSNLDVKGKINISLYMVKNHNNFSICTKRNFSYVCNDTKLYHQLGYTNFCNLDNFPRVPCREAEFTLGCDITFCDESENSISMRNQFKQLMKDQTWSDFTIKVDTQEFKVHKSILAARSPVLKTMLAINIAEKKSNLLEIIDIDPKILKLMIEFIYTSKVDLELDHDQVIDLLIVADKYEMQDLKDFCTDCFKETLNIENFAEHLVLAVKYKSESLMAAVKKIIRTKENISDILCDTVFKYL